jgi:AAA family ATP:ADP antiporter
MSAANLPNPIVPLRRGERALVLLLGLDVFLILCGYYLLKTVREGLILSSGTFGLRGDELKLYATAAMALLLLGAVPLYGALARRMSRIRLIRASYLAVLTCLGTFFVLGRTGVPVGLAFYLWLGIANLFLVGQFWSYAADICTAEQGRRLFGAIGVGGALGALVGPRLAALTDTWSAMAIAAGLLLVCLGIFPVLERLPAGAAGDGAPLDGRGGFDLVRRDRYLLLIAVMLVVANLVNTIGEYILSSEAVAHAGGDREAIKAFYADFYGWVNLIGLGAQLFVVTRLIQVSGIRTALLVLPAIALAGYGLIGLVGGLALVRVAKTAENATDYSLQNTVRQALFLSTSRDAKYKAKAAIDTFFVRAGDLGAALVVMLAVRGLGLGPGALAAVNVGLALIWLGVAIALGRAHRRRAS